MCDILLENDDATFAATLELSVVSASLFKRKYPPPPALPECPKTSPYETFDGLDNIKSFSDISGDWLTMEATLPPCKPTDCQGHFYDNPTLAHSVMLFHNCDLLGKAISEYTGLDLPYKRSDFGQEHGMKMLSWTVSLGDCIPVLLVSRILNFALWYPSLLHSCLPVLAREPSLPKHLRPQASIQDLLKQGRARQAWLDVLCPM